MAVVGELCPEGNVGDVLGRGLVVDCGVEVADTTVAVGAGQRRVGIAADGEEDGERKHAPDFVEEHVPSWGGETDKTFAGQ